MWWGFGFGEKIKVENELKKKGKGIIDRGISIILKREWVDWHLEPIFVRLFVEE